ncbi:MAG: Gfo/Idh/MocA family oxidoreductase [Leptospirales bacterium]|nr:Gfo/Idh/MocA family oxidoreductase [Leptospirales bacterium]
MKTRWRVALLGLGRIAWTLEKDRLRRHPCTHAGALAALPGRFELSAVCDRNPERIAQFARWWKKPIAAQGVSAHRLLQDGPFDLVINAASSEAHLALGLAAARGAAAALALEKPLAANLRQAARLADQLKRSSALVWINFERRYHNSYRTARQYIASGELGALRSIHGQVLTGATPADAALGPLTHDAVHWIDLLLWFCGYPDRTSARVVRSARLVQREDHVFCDFEYPGFSARLEAGGGRNYFQFEMQLDFSDGRIQVGNSGARFFRSSTSRRYEGFRELKEFKPRIIAENPWVEFYRDIDFQLLRSKDDPKSAKHSSQLRIMDALNGMQLIHECIQRGRRTLSPNH